MYFVKYCDKREINFKIQRGISKGNAKFSSPPL